MKMLMDIITIGLVVGLWAVAFYCVKTYFDILEQNLEERWYEKWMI